MSRTFIWAMVFLLGSIALLLIFAMPKTSAGSFTGFSASDYKPMNDFIDRFNKNLAKEGDSNNLLPASELSQKDLSWLFKDYPDVTLKAVKGLRFANSDVLIVFCIETDKPYLQELMKETISAPVDLGSVLCVGGDIKYMIGAKNYKAIQKMVEDARQGSPDSCREGLDPSDDHIN